ncbi:MAG: GtrA family protein [Patescibacteria group bacterium]
MTLLIRQFMLYIASGGAAVVFDFGSYFLLLRLGTWYVGANIISTIIGFFAAFLLHKFIVFGKRDAMVNHFVRYCVLNVLNIAAQTLLLYIFVEYLRMGEGDGKFLSWAITILWNFFLYKYFVYV